MENVEKIYVDEDFEYQVKIECSKCHERADSWHAVGSNELLAIPGSRGEANYIYRCKLCKSVNTLNIVKDSRQPYLSEHVPKMMPIVTFEVRGLLVVDFAFGEGWKVASSESSHVFEEASLDDDFCDYDENANCPVGVTELQFSIVK